MPDIHVYKVYTANKHPFIYLGNIMKHCHMNKHMVILQCTMQLKPLKM